MVVYLNAFRPRWERLVASRHVRVAVLVSGTGTILEAVLADGPPVHLVVADRPCRGLDVAADAGIDPAQGRPLRIPGPSGPG